MLRTFEHAARGGATGELNLFSDSLDARVYLERGRVAWAMSSRSRFSFGRELARRAKMDPKELRDVVERSRRDRISLGRALTATSSIGIETVRDALRLQIKDAIGTVTEGDVATASRVFRPRAPAGLTYDEALTFTFEEVCAEVGVDTLLDSDSESPLKTAATIEMGERMANIKESLAKILEIDGAIGCCVVDSNSGMMLGSSGNSVVNLEVAAAGNTEVVRAKRKTMKALGLNDAIEDMLITLGRQYHLIRPLTSNDALFIYLVLDKTRGNLALARHQLTAIERELVL